MAMTSSVELIQLYTKGQVREIGNIICNGQKFIPNSEGDRILDYNNKNKHDGTYNFHLFPIIKSETEKKIWIEYFKRVEKLRNEIIKKLNANRITKIEYKNPSKIENYDSTTYYLAYDVGKKGNLYGISQYYKDNGLNHFFRCIPIYKNGRYYSINFMRFYLDKEYKVNCIFDQIQFDSSKNGNVNSEDEINYPATYKGQNKKMIRLSQNGSCVFNPPKIANIWNCDSDNTINEIVETFIEFMDNIENNR